jgi:hypothetical protein
VLNERYGVRVLRVSSEAVEHHAWKVAQKLRAQMEG